MCDGRRFPACLPARLRPCSPAAEGRYELVVVSPRSYFLYTPLLPSAAAGSVQERSIMEPVRNLLHGKVGRCRRRLPPGPRPPRAATACPSRAGAASACRGGQIGRRRAGTWPLPAGRAAREPQGQYGCSAAVHSATPATCRRAAATCRRVAVAPGPPPWSQHPRPHRRPPGRPWPRLQGTYFQAEATAIDPQRRVLTCAVDKCAVCKTVQREEGKCDGKGQAGCGAARDTFELPYDVLIVGVRREEGGGRKGGARRCGVPLERGLKQCVRSRPPDGVPTVAGHAPMVCMRR